MLVEVCGKYAIVAPMRPAFGMIAQVFSRAGAAKIVAELLPLRAPIDNFIFRDMNIVGLRVLEVRPAVASSRDTPSTIGGRPISSSHRPPASASIILRRFAFLLTRRRRALRSFVQAWGGRSLFKLRRLNKSKPVD